MRNLKSTGTALTLLVLTFGVLAGNYLMNQKGEDTDTRSDAETTEVDHQSPAR